MKKTSGIYCITNIKNGKKYVGQSRDIKRRWKSHIAVAAKDTESNSILYRAMRKHGIDNFKFRTLEHCGENELDELEIEYIKKLESMSFQWGYNIEFGGNVGSKISPLVRQRKMGKNNPMFGKKMSERQKKLISLSNRGINNKLNKEDVKVIKERLLNGESQMDISTDYNISNDAINKIFRCVNWKWVSPELNEALITYADRIAIDRDMEVKRLYGKGFTATHISKVVGCNMATVTDIVGTSRVKESRERASHIETDFIKGMSKENIMKKYNVKRSVVNRATKEAYQLKKLEMYKEWSCMRRKGMSVDDIAAKYNVHRTTVTENTKDVWGNRSGCLNVLNENV